MNFATRLWSMRSVRTLTGITVCAVPICALIVGTQSTEGANAPVAATQVLSNAVLGAPGGTLNPSAVAGSTKCVECHKSEMAALTKSKHHSSLKLIEAGGNIAKYAKAVGIGAADVMKDSVCVTCHATPQGDAGSVHAISSVSCESCHGGSTGDPEWLKLHATKGITDAQRKQCDEAGMIRASSVYAIAKNCAGCHLVSNQDLVNAGHPVTTKWDFELVGGSSGEVRHNFQMDQKKNAVAPSLWLKLNEGASAENRRRQKYLVGMLVDLEVTLGYLKSVPKADGKEDFAKGHAKRLKSVAKNLEKAVKELGKAAPEELVAAHEAIEAMGRVSSFNFKSQAAAMIAEPILAASAQAVAEKYDGSTLAALDKLIEKEVEPRGDAFTP